ncbi:hypothetical protein F383_02735 [Gossypium arboreum]|uniref:Uncharacterized protein n=1 Tax=Gossypium arboreum TaxID=29729 RepID=A0A0B0PKQ4_GOSAR|nr:hypothetical protein F383_02735 [Gossypium arboreum]
MFGTWHWHETSYKTISGIWHRYVDL